MGAVRRNAPGAMPVDAAVREVRDRLQAPFLIAGLSRLAGRKVVCFLHGYNVSTREGLQHNECFFALLEASLARDGHNLADYGCLGFTWPGDVGPVHFNDAQRFAHPSGTALYFLVTKLAQEHQVRSIALVTHSLGAHVGLRGAAILGECLFRRAGRLRFASALLLAPAVEDDVFHRPRCHEEYHFPKPAFGMGHQHMFVSRDDNVLGVAFRVNEVDAALGFAGPESLEPFQSLPRRVREVTTEHNDPQEFRFQLHDLSTSSHFIMNSKVWARGHGDYWARPAQRTIA